METFEEIIRDMNKERQEKEYSRYLSSRVNGTNEYILFKCWCNAFKNGKGKDNAEVFAEYLKENNIELDFWTRKRIAEKYFGYKFKFNHNILKWEQIKS